MEKARNKLPDNTIMTAEVINSFGLPCRLYNFLRNTYEGKTISELKKDIRDTIERVGLYGNLKKVGVLSVPNFGRKTFVVLADYFNISNNRHRVRCELCGSILKNCK